MIHIYLAAPYEIRPQARKFAERLTSSGYIACTASWLFDEHPVGPEAAQIDIDDIDRADILVALNPSPWHQKGTGGRHAELGYAIARQKPILLLGERSQLFHWHPLVSLSASPADAERSIMELALARARQAAPLGSYFKAPAFDGQ